MPDQANLSQKLLLRCLGHAQLEGAGADVIPRTRKARALLAYLALTGRSTSRDRLADLLWSSRASEQAKASLRQAIFELRHVRCGDAPLILLGADDVALNAELLSTDLERIKQAAAEDDFAALALHLSRSEPGLVDNLDGLDPEFDAWLHIERAQEPARTFAAAHDAAERCFRDRSAREALAIVVELQRLDPCSEETARLALRIAHAMGDQAAVHRHYELLTNRLKNDLDALPSVETEQLFRLLTTSAEQPMRWKRDEPKPAQPRAELRAESPVPRRRSLPVAAVAAAVVLTLLLLGGGWRYLHRTSTTHSPPLIAVVPFEQLAGADKFLAQGLWEDTRSALSETRAFRVLGRATSQSAAEARLAPEDYKQRFGVDYLLQGSVRRTGDNVRIVVSLTKTSSGADAWEGSFSGRLGDPLALQQAIARMIEGRLRGRLAPGGGRRAQQIPTSAEVYELYSEARTLLRDRTTEDVARAKQLLERAVAQDPNFAPAWSSLAVANFLDEPGPAGIVAARAQAVQQARRALALAPNLAEAHATIGLVSGGRSATAVNALNRAVSLDPGNAEAWLWLGNSYGNEFDLQRAATHYRRAVDIDPLWFPAVHNLVFMLTELGDHSGAMTVAQNVENAGGDQELLLTTRSEIMFLRGDYSAALGPLLAYRRKHGVPPGSNFVVALAEPLTALGYYEEAGRLLGYDWYAPVMRGETLLPDPASTRQRNPLDFWFRDIVTAVATRAFLNQGRADLVLAKYRKAFRSSDDFISEMWSSPDFEIIAPSVAMALRRTAPREADYLLSTAARRLDQAIAEGRRNREALMRLSRIRAAQGRREEALLLLTQSIRAGFLPNGWTCAVDLADEPVFQGLRDDRRFEALRQQILRHVSREQSELGPIGT